MRRHLGVFVLLVAVGAPVASADGKRERNQRIGEVFERAERILRKADQGCRFAAQRLPSKPSFTFAPPSDAMLATLAILRRPQTAEERELGEEEFVVPPFVRGAHRRHVRIAHSATGRRFVIVVARNAASFPSRPRRCLEKRKRIFRRLIAGEPRAFRRAALRVLRLVTRGEASTPKGPREGVFLFGRRGGGGGTSARDLRRRGMFFSIGGRPGQPTRVDGLVPDPVAEVTAIFPKRSHGRRPYRRPVSRTAEVRDNVVSIEGIPRSAPDALNMRMIWRDAEGQVVRRVDGATGRTW